MALTAATAGEGHSWREAGTRACPEPAAGAEEIADAERIPAFGAIIMDLMGGWRGAASTAQDGAGEEPAVSGCGGGRGPEREDGDRKSVV